MRIHEPPADTPLLHELWRLSTVFKDVDCDCCDLPLYSEFCQEL